jgi:tRNA pseudouridine55 synthase
MDGVIVVDKPPGWTSHDAVNKLRRLVNTRKVGHLGTLDPLATGVLPLVVGKATRLAQFYMRGDKIYDAIVHFGYSTDTYDADGIATSAMLEPDIDRDWLEEMLGHFRGALEQIPPPISAKKVSGVPAYRLTRKNVPVDLKPVEIQIHSIELVESSASEARIRVRCSAGTYMRSIAHELGQAAGCGAFLKTLRRLASGDFTIEMARTVEQLDALAKQGLMGEALIAASQLLPEFPSERVDAATAAHIRQGRDFRVSPFRVRQGTRYVKAIGPEGELVAIGEVRLPNVYHPILVL